jgi:hypothetical protein
MKRLKNSIHVIWRTHSWFVSRYVDTRLAWTLFFVVFVASYPLALAADKMFQLLIPAPSNPEAMRGRLYSDSRDRIILDCDLGRTDNDKVYFWDGHPLFGLDDAEATALANTPGLPQKFAKGHGFVQLETIFGGIARAEHSALHVQDIDAPMCQWPYDSMLKIEQDDKSVLKVMFFRRRKVPKTAHYRVYCEGGQGDVDLTTEFENVPPLIYLDRNGWPLLAFGGPPVVLRFNENGKEVGPWIASGITAVPAVMVDHYYEMVAEGDMRAQAAIDLIDAELNRVGSKHP